MLETRRDLSHGLAQTIVATPASNERPETQPRAAAFGASPQKPRLGFLGVGWIGRNRLEAVARSGLAEIAAIADPVRELAAQAAELAPGARQLTTLDELLEQPLDGIVIATPSALHAEQAIAAFRRGLAVFCQKPLGRDAAETRSVVEAARGANQLLSVDFCYRHLTGIQRLRDLIQNGELGRIYAVDAVFHNAYGPDKKWFYDPRLSGGGCVIDLGIHLADLALWMLDFPAVVHASSRMFARGCPLVSPSESVEDYATARLDLAGGATVQLACSWRLPAGCDALIRASFYGTQGGAELRNVNGSFYDFVAERFQGTSRQPLASPPDDWGGRAILRWVEQLSRSSRFDPEAERIVEVAAALDAIYGRTDAAPSRRPGGSFAP